MVANGSEVSTMVEGAKLLTEKEGLNVHVVSAPSEGLFRLQKEEYQESVIPKETPPVWINSRPSGNTCKSGR